jgi:hypothetical protein
MSDGLLARSRSLHPRSFFFRLIEAVPGVSAWLKEQFGCAEGATDAGAQ